MLSRKINALKPETVCACDGCREPIFEDEHYYLIDNKAYCTRCIDRARKIADVEEFCRHRRMVSLKY